MHPPAVLRDRLEATLTAFLDYWSGENVGDVHTLFSPAVHFQSSHRGDARGREAVATMLAVDSRDRRIVHITGSNEVVRFSGREGVMSAYFFGEVRDHEAPNSSAALFGGFVTLMTCVHENIPLIHDIRMQINWVQGNAALLTDWTLPVQDRAWQPGDRVATIVSEMDSPWTRTDLHAAESDQYAVVETWYRYAWALDQGDFSLLAGCFSEDAQAVLTPMGHLRGRREVVGTLKAFRFPWPWMQHYGTPLKIEIDSEQGTARLWIGRLMPGKTQQADGSRLLGAHYQIRLRRHDAEPWLIEWMEYVPGWFSA
ncbi:nuclear transport factor 2 family protein [Cupriavidus sp. MP-37]|uniref:nuclear transport factor 2 family protein n=1 Tax=Cupriavidus sp. MP-37 TaxID=2884455 RepID=UPI001D0A9DCD|nr:nuclear transport factor 2 family protein [Cupriavidus sp. MP-37]UDM52007.1 nuclear transport factor 2 family protein [Cupriavidus sp. MP-37]